MVGACLASIGTFCLGPQTHDSAVVAHACNSSTPSARLEADTGDSPEAHGSACLVHTTATSKNQILAHTKSKTKVYIGGCPLTATAAPFHNCPLPRPYKHAHKENKQTNK